MDRQEFASKIDSALPIERQDLTREKFECECRYINIRKLNPHLLFDIERHPGAGESQPGQPYTTLQTWRYDDRTNRLKRVCEFARWHMDKIEQNDEGKPVCRNCGNILDPHEDVFGFCWRCFDCGAIGGKEQEIFNPSLGEGLGERADYVEVEQGLWVPVGADES